ncbi:hypothetical protein GCM10010317_033090 [Streptomyces mirabilis]|nr:hypothetical protein GCM10010317_033090 [Streptomyces mirabilis]
MSGALRPAAGAEARAGCAPSTASTTPTTPTNPTNPTNPAIPDLARLPRPAMRPPSAAPGTCLEYPPEYPPGSPFGGELCSHLFPSSRVYLREW